MEATESTEELLTADQVCAGLKLCRKTLSTWIHRGIVPYVRLAPRTVRFKRSAIEAWLAARTHLPAAKPAAHPGRR